jgi:hypothetical protein
VPFAAKIAGVAGSQATGPDVFVELIHVREVGVHVPVATVPEGILPVGAHSRPPFGVAARADVVPQLPDGDAGAVPEPFQAATPANPSSHGVLSSRVTDCRSRPELLKALAMITGPRVSSSTVYGVAVEKTKEPEPRVAVALTRDSVDMPGVVVEIVAR